MCDHSYMRDRTQLDGQSGQTDWKPKAAEAWGMPLRKRDGWALTVWECSEEH